MKKKSNSRDSVPISWPSLCKSRNQAWRTAQICSIKWNRRPNERPRLVLAGNMPVGPNHGPRGKKNHSCGHQLPALERGLIYYWVDINHGHGRQSCVFGRVGCLGRLLDLWNCASNNNGPWNSAQSLQKRQETNPKAKCYATLEGSR